MAFVDEITIHAKAGRGGDGVVRWLHLKGKEFSGPAGGDGGKGGDVVVRAVRDIAVLSRFKFEKTFKAEKGEHGGNQSMFGKGGEDLILTVPVGSIITNRASHESIELLTEGETAIVLKGGRGGLGNENFKSSTNRNPEQSTPGQPGEEADLHIELKLIVDAGFVGLPNAGKSSLLNTLTHAKAKVADYPFTTLDPNLGDFYGFILADIPGLIEGASAGKGLGHKFLRHISRTRVLIHCVSAEHEDPGSVYETVRNELASFDESLSRKAQMTVLTKTDLVDPDTLAKRMKLLKKACGSDPFGVTVLFDASVKRFSDALTAFLRREEK